METYELESIVRNALVSNTELMNALPLGSKAVYHHVAPTVEPKRYPIIVFSPISDVPHMSGDNRELAHRVTIRIHVIASQKRFEADENNFITACRLVKDIMAGLHFSRRQTIPFCDDGKVMRIIDFVRRVKS